MPTTPVYALRYPASTDPANVPSDIGNLASDVEKILGGALSATPPASPVTGQLWAFPADATNGIVWLFRYNAASASTYKWEFVGGPPLVADDPTIVSGITATSYTTIGPTVTVPRAGDYNWRLDCMVFVNSTGQGINVSVKLGAAAVSDDDSAQVFVGTGSPANSSLSVSRGRRAAGLAASAAITIYGKTNLGAAGFLNRTLTVTPSRIS